MQFIKLIFGFVILIASANAAENTHCPAKLTFELSKSKKICLSDYPIAQENLINSEKKVIDFVKKSECVSIAVSTESACRAIGISNINDSHCATFSSFNKPLRDDDAIRKCKSFGCNCELVISEWKVVNDKLFLGWESRSASSGIANSIDKNNAEADEVADKKIVENKNKDSLKTNVLDKNHKNLEENQKKLEKESLPRQQAKNKKVINLQISNTQPNSDGEFFIQVQTNADTASLQIDGVEEGGKQDGNYLIKRVARAGQTSSYKISATDVFGNSDNKIISITRQLAVSDSIKYAELNPAIVKFQQSKDAVAIIIGIADYKNLPRADFANDDARVFYDYAIRALGVKPENIKLLVDADADDIGIYQAFKTWLPSRVRASTDVYVYYSGHGLPTADGQGLYLLPQRAHRDFIDKTAITQSEINAAIQAAKPRSVTVFLDSCYSGQTRSGETLIASARPVALKTEKQLFPENFTVITASQADQISSSSPDLKHGIFSYYLMRGMEGDADANGDGKITAGEMQAYLAETVSRQAGMMNRAQQPQLIGDASRVLVGR